jgi:pSer/pThr/pTyr-binding forkhead associated (FHA) protein
MPVLLIHKSGQDVMKYEMTEDAVTIGRTRENTVALAGDSGISRTHCRIKRAGQTFVVEDAGSANGTRLNGKNIGKSTAPLCSGDKIGIGSTQIEFDDPLSPKRSWVSKMLAVLGGSAKGPADGGAKVTSDGTIFGDGFVKCGKCGAKIHTGSKSAGQKVGCGRCRSVYVIPPK